MQNYFRMEIPAYAANAALARISVAALAAQLDPTLEDINDIKTAVSEAVTNSIIHGYPQGGGQIRIYAEITEDNLLVEISDEGLGIEDLEQAREPLYTTRPDLERSGMGFTIMENLMDRVDIETSLGEGLVLRMWKQLKIPDNADIQQDAI